MFRQELYNAVDKVITYSELYGDDDDAMFGYAINEFIDQYENEEERGYITVEDLMERLSEFSSYAQVISCYDPYLGIRWLMIRDGDKANTILTQKWEKE